VLGVGNASGFVEPLEATALLVVCQQLSNLMINLEHCSLVPTPTIRRLYNNMLEGTWNEVRDFLALHYKLNTRLDTPFWKHCREDTDMGNLGDLLEFYAENGPTGLTRYTLPKFSTTFEIEGYLVMLVGNGAPYRARHRPGVHELGLWKRHLAENASRARAALTVRQALDLVRHPGWTWSNPGTRIAASAQNNATLLGSPVKA
jgi:tryptophan 7-halogenase